MSNLWMTNFQSASAASKMEAGKGGRIIGTAMEAQVDAYCTVNRFLSGFIDRVNIHEHIYNMVA